MKFGIGRVGPVVTRLSLAQRFMVGSLVILLLGMAGVGAWVAHRIEQGVIHRTAATTALYVDSLIAGSLQDLASQDAPSAEGAERLDWLLEDTPLGQEVAVFRVWDRTGRVVYSTVPALVGERVPVAGDLAAALSGRVTATVGELEGTRDLPAGVPRDDLLEIYSPVRSTDTGEVIAVAEFYYAADELMGEITAARRRSWLVVGGAAVAIYLLLAAFVQRASNTIVRQQRVLADQVARLTELLRQNDELHGRVRGAAARTTALNERFLRRISAELHDGPAQEIGLALLRLDHVAAHCTADGQDAATQTGVAQDLGAIEASLRRALQEVRAVSSGLLLPELEQLTLAQTIERALRGHRRRTGAAVAVDCGGLPEQAPLAIKIALYRIAQEALTNAWRHADGANPTLRVERIDDRVRLEVCDDGPGFDAAAVDRSSERLGLLGMRERVESLGGEFALESAPGCGTRVVATLPHRPIGGPNGQAG